MAKTGSSQDVLELLRGLSSAGETVSAQRRLLDEQHQKMIERAIQQAQFQAGMNQKEKELAQEKELFGLKEKGETARLNISEKGLSDRQFADAKVKIMEGLRAYPDLAKLAPQKLEEIAKNIAGSLIQGKPYPVTPGAGGEFHFQKPQPILETIKEHPGELVKAGLGGLGIGLLTSPYTGFMGPVVSTAAALAGRTTGLQGTTTVNLGLQKGEFSEGAEDALVPIFQSVGEGKKTASEAKPFIMQAYTEGKINLTELQKANDYVDRLQRGETTPRNAPREVMAAAKAQVQKGSILDMSKPPPSPDWVQTPKPYVSSVPGMALAGRMADLASKWNDDNANAMEREIYQVPDSRDRENLTLYLGKLKVNRHVFALTPTPIPTPNP